MLLIHSKRNITRVMWGKRKLIAKKRDICVSVKHRVAATQLTENDNNNKVSDRSLWASKQASDQNCMRKDGESSLHALWVKGKAIVRNKMKKKIERGRESNVKTLAEYLNCADPKLPTVFFSSSKSAIPEAATGGWKMAICPRMPIVCHMHTHTQTHTR